MKLFRPEQASSYASQLDQLYLFLCGLALFFVATIFILLFVFAVRYRRTSNRPRRRAIHGNLWLEVSWFAMPLLLTLVMFIWGAVLYFETATPPQDALEVYAVGKQWMWKIQHPEGRREINRLHVPVGQPVRVVLASKDVIHSFYIPAFRIKMDAVPGRYSQVWFNATKPGTYHLFCAEYCGTNHSRMRGQVIAMEPAEYQAWLAGGTGESMVIAGRRLFTQLGCQPCHQETATQRGPSLDGIFKSTTRLANAESVLVDEAYLRESILDPKAKLVAGYEPVMPTFKGQISEEELLKIIVYIKSLTKDDGTEAQP